MWIIYVVAAFLGGIGLGVWAIGLVWLVRLVWVRVTLLDGVEEVTTAQEGPAPSGELGNAVHHV